VGGLLLVGSMVSGLELERMGEFSSFPGSVVLVLVIRYCLHTAHRSFLYQFTSLRLLPTHSHATS